MQLRSKRLVVLTTLTLWTVLFSVNTVRANPSGEAVVAGAATFQRGAGNLQITTSDRAIINWQNFSIGHGEVTSFLQPSASSAVLNRVISGNPSSLLGGLQSNGRVFLINPNGILVGAGARIDTAGFLASTLDTSDSSFLSGGNMSFIGNSSASVVNHGTINAAGGDIFLIARKVENHGALNAPSGTVGLAAGTEVLITQAGEERVFVQLPEAASVSGDGVVNAGVIEAATAELKAHGNIYALAINNSGTVRATGATTRDGRVLLTAPGGNILNTGEISATRGDSGGDALVAGSKILNTGTIRADGNANGGLVRLEGSDRVTLAPGSVTSAKAGASGAGGSVYVRAMGGENSSTLFLPGSLIDVRGGATGGNAGFIDVSSAGGMIFSGDFDLRAARGWRGGHILIDPRDAYFENTQTPGTTLVGSTDPDWNPTGTSDANLLRIGFGEYGAAADLSFNPQSGGSFSGGRFGDDSTIEVNAQRDLIVYDWFDLNTATDGGQNVRLILKANGNIGVQANITGDGSVAFGSFATPNYQIQLIADADNNGSGGLFIKDGALVRTLDGAILLAGNTVELFRSGGIGATTTVFAGGANGNLVAQAGAGVFVGKGIGSAQLTANHEIKVVGDLQVGQSGNSASGEVQADLLALTGNLVLEGGTTANADATVEAETINADGYVLVRSSAQADATLRNVNDLTAANLILDASAGGHASLGTFSTAPLNINVLDDIRIFSSGPNPANAIGVASIDSSSINNAGLVTITAGHDVALGLGGFLTTASAPLLVKAGHSIQMDDGSAVNAGAFTMASATFVTDNANPNRPNYDSTSQFILDGYMSVSGRLLIFGVRPSQVGGNEDLPDPLQYDTYFGEPVIAGDGLVFKFQQDNNPPPGGTSPPGGNPTAGTAYLLGEVSEVLTQPPQTPPVYGSGIEPGEVFDDQLDDLPLPWFLLAAVGNDLIQQCFHNEAQGIAQNTEDRRLDLAAVRHFRDEYLQTSEIGREIIALYYRLSPGMIDAYRNDIQAQHFLAEYDAAVVAFANALRRQENRSVPMTNALESPELAGVREFRDRYLSQNESGHQLASLIDKVSPAILEAVHVDAQAHELISSFNEILLAVAEDLDAAKSTAQIASPSAPREIVSDLTLLQRFSERYLTRNPQGRQFAALCKRIAPTLLASLVKDAMDGKNRGALRDWYTVAVAVARDTDEAQTILAQRNIPPSVPQVAKVKLAAANLK